MVRNGRNRNNGGSPKTLLAARFDATAGDDIPAEEVPMIRRPWLLAMSLVVCSSLAAGSARAERGVLSDAAVHDTINCRTRVVVKRPSLQARTR